MSLFTKKAPRPEYPALAIGHLPCTERGCLSDQGLACVYVDRRGRACETAWCPQHLQAVRGKPYCRRHAGVVQALPDVEPGALPDVDNRAPSLLEWVSHEVGHDIAAIVGGAATAGQKVQEDLAHLTLIHNGKDRIRAWERTWKLYDHTGIHLWVALDVEEEHDLEVLIRVNGTAVGRLTPPWITARRNGIALTPEADTEQRRHYYADIVDTVRRHMVEPT